MTDIGIIENKISTIQKYLHLLDKYKKYSLKEIKKNPTLQGALERYLYLAAQATIDLGEATLSFKNLRKPTTYAEIFDILKEESFIDTDLQEEMVKMVGFRNIITHGYEKIDLNIVYDILQHRLTDIKKFILAIKEKLRL